MRFLSEETVKACRDAEKHLVNSLYNHGSWSPCKRSPSFVRRLITIFNHSSHLGCKAVRDQAWIDFHKKAFWNASYEKLLQTHKGAHHDCACHFIVACFEVCASQDALLTDVVVLRHSKLRPRLTNVQKIKHCHNLQSAGVWIFKLVNLPTCILINAHNQIKPVSGELFGHIKLWTSHCNLQVFR